MRAYIVGGLVAVGAFVSRAFGGWSASLNTLCIFMAIDYVTGLIVALVFNRSPKSEHGGISSGASVSGLFRKGGILAMVFIGARLDILTGSGYIRDGMCIAFIVNELISITENAGLMGIPIPAVLKKVIDVLKEKTEKEDESIS